MNKASWFIIIKTSLVWSVNMDYVGFAVKIVCPLVQVDSNEKMDTMNNEQ